MLLKRQYWRNILTSVVLCCVSVSFASDTLSLDTRKKIVVGGNIVGYSSLMSGLYFLWYADYPMSKFHLLNDNKEWLQMDKTGHAFSCYYEGIAGMKMMQWAGYSKNASAIIGGSYGFFIQSGVEVLDGFSDGWGASWGDMAANAVGSGLAISQEILWNDQRIGLKFSYSGSPYAQARPNVLGSNFPERLLKDYNGQTYWLTTNIKSFAPNSKVPAWLNIAIGYGADGMYGGFGNTFTSNGVVYDYTSTPRSRQFYISPDIDVTKIKTNKKLIKAGLIVLNSIKVPMPTLEYHSTKGLRASFLHF